MPPSIMSPATKSDNFKVASGQHTTVAAVDTVDTGLQKVESIVVSLDDDPVDGAMYATAVKGSAGTVSIKTWKNTDADATHVASTTFGKKVNWIAFGY